MEQHDSDTGRSNFDLLPDSAFVREAQLVHRCYRRDGATALPFGPTTLWRMVRVGEFPKPVKLSTRVSAWRVGDVRAWIRKRAGQAEGAQA